MEHRPNPLQGPTKLCHSITAEKKSIILEDPSWISFQYVDSLSKCTGHPRIESYKEHNVMLFLVVVVLLWHSLLLFTVKRNAESVILKNQYYMSGTHHKTAKPTCLTYKSASFIVPSNPPLSVSVAVFLQWVGPLQLLHRISTLSSARALLHADAFFIREVSSHRRCGLVMISRDYGWLMVGKYIRNHQLGDGEGISLTLVDLHWSTANEWGLAASSYLPTDK